MDWLMQPETWIALLTLTALEIVLGIDNIIFISILAAKLPGNQQDQARRLGLAGAMLTRIALLFSIAWLIRLTAPLFSFLGQEISGRDIILLVGGLFLLAKSTSEIHDKLQGLQVERTTAVPASLTGVLVQIMLLDVVFSLDSVITAIGMANQLPVMIAAIVIAVGIMMFSSKPISDFIHENPTFKILALSFLLLIGVSLMAEGLAFHIPKGYIYFAMGFSFFVELINLRVRTGGRRVIRPHGELVQKGPES